MKKRKRILSLVFAACLVISGFVPGAGVPESRSCCRRDRSDRCHGLRVYPDSGKDSAVGIQKAIAAAKEATNEGRKLRLISRKVAMISTLIKRWKKNYIFLIP